MSSCPTLLPPHVQQLETSASPFGSRLVENQVFRLLRSHLVVQNSVRILETASDRRPRTRTTLSTKDAKRSLVRTMCLYLPNPVHRAIPGLDSESSLMVYFVVYPTCILLTIIRRFELVDHFCILQKLQTSGLQNRFHNLHSNNLKDHRSAKFANLESDRPGNIMIVKGYESNGHTWNELALC
jgi:hypothetical protein